MTQGINNGLPYKYVVGAAGNYPGTPAGLQAAINDAGSNPIFIKSDFSGSSPSVTLGAHTKLIGCANENPAGTFFYQNGVPNFDQSTQSNTTIINCTLVIPAGGINAILENICYFPPAALFTCNITDNNLYNLTLNNCKLFASSGNGFNITVSDFTFSTFQLNANNSSINGDTCSLFILTNNGGVGSSTLNFIAHFSNGSTIGFSEQSTLTGYGVSYNLNVSNSFYAAPIKWISGDVTSVYLDLNNCIIADMGNGHPLLEGALYNLYLQQLQDVTFSYSDDFSASPVPVIKDSPTNLVSNYQCPPQALAFTNCVWTANSTVYDAFQAITAPYSTSQDQAINAIRGKFNSILTTPTSSHTATGTFGSSLTLGTAIHNTLGYDINVCIGFAVSTATAATIVLGVGSTSTPTTDTVVPSFSTAACALSINAVVPAGYYLLVDKTGTITSTNSIVVTPL